MLDVIAIFVKRARADTLQFSARQRGLHHIARVQRPLRCSSADHVVQFVDEQDDLAAGCLDFVQHGLEPFFKLATKARARHHAAQVQFDQAPVHQVFRHVAVDDALRQSFDDGRLAHTGIADQHRVVLRAACQHTHDTHDLVVASDHRVELGIARERCQIAPELVQAAVFRLGMWIGNLVAAANLLDGLQRALFADRAFAQYGRGGTVPLG